MDVTNLCQISLQYNNNFDSLPSYREITIYEAAMHGPLLCAFMGTMVLVLLGDGVVANVLLKKSKGEGSGWCNGCWIILA